MSDNKPMGFDDEDLERFLVLLSQRTLSNITVRSLVWQFRKLKRENECLRKIAKDFQEVCTVGSPTWMAIEETLRENKEQL